MELRNCPVCGKLFVYTVRNLCPECAKKDEENFEKVRQYLYDVPQATLEEIAEKNRRSRKECSGIFKRRPAYAEKEQPEHSEL
ncbi:hypothetical protein [Biomaibacter acetigenes]|uniref:hypothetical protein n=1 Tax=Biomaibacter acetigenes TaxID=2316383 RepID=UPI001FE4247F|nr:hypothetical protein [Biomaibacter acetigenes]